MFQGHTGVFWTGSVGWWSTGGAGVQILATGIAMCPTENFRGMVLLTNSNIRDCEHLCFLKFVSTEGRYRQVFPICKTSYIISAVLYVWLLYLTCCFRPINKKSGPCNNLLDDRSSLAGSDSEISWQDLLLSRCSKTAFFIPSGLHFRFKVVLVLVPRVQA